MNPQEKQQRPNRIGSRSDYGTFDPDRFWGQPLPDLTKHDGPDDFEARVERAMRYVQNAFFAKEEHAALAEAIVRVISRHAGTAPQKHDEPASPGRMPLG